MKILQKTMYETSDKKCFDTESDALRHERLLAAFQDAHEKHACYGTFEFHDYSEFSKFVCTYADMIRGDAE